MLLLLTALSLIGFTAATLTIVDSDGNVPIESRMVFAGLSAVYVLFFNFCKDMNDPFDGVYQIKRSSAASYLLQIKWLIANQSFGKDVRFDTRGLDPVYDGDEVVEIGKGLTKASSTESPTEPPNGKTCAAEQNGQERLHQLQTELAKLRELQQQQATSAAPRVAIGKERSSASSFVPEREEGKIGF